ncbi:Allantoicase [Rhizopus stolonifer]|uniref:Allantoicase n=1 Tax=Rhizopus stolonifer TaxID=4846 RepID=A0A367IS08_RHIST|nr:Allantoicase [Rhizopus stolonifer]
MSGYQRISFEELKQSSLSGCIDLASSALGSSIVKVTDEFFAAASNMINPLPPIHAPGKFVETGAWMDGWESKRHNPDHDWAIIKLGFHGTFEGFDIDTHYFTGNQAPFASVEAAYVPAGSDVESDKTEWTEILPKVPLPPTQHNVFVLDKPTKVYSHLRLNNIPDGGIARFRAYGHVSPTLPKDKSQVIDLAFCGNGGRAVDVSDAHYTPGSNILLPGRGKNMGDGWETKRSRTPNHTDHVTVRLGQPGHLLKAVIDTSDYRGNYPHKIILQATKSQEFNPKDSEWTTLIEPASVGPHGLFYFDLPHTDKTFSHAKIIIVPDGGIKRLRLYGVLEGAEVPKTPIDIGDAATA